MRASVTPLAALLLLAPPLEGQVGTSDQAIALGAAAGILAAAGASVCGVPASLLSASGGGSAGPTCDGSQNTTAPATTTSASKAGTTQLGGPCWGAASLELAAAGCAASK